MKLSLSKTRTIAYIMAPFGLKMPSDYVPKISEPNKELKLTIKGTTKRGLNNEHKYKRY